MMSAEGSKHDDELYCLCRKKYEEGQFMIECGKCNGWFHGSCVGIEEYQAQDVDVYHCPDCQIKHGPLLYSFLDVKLNSGKFEMSNEEVKKRRNVSRHNYKEIHDGTKQISAGTVMFVRQLKARKFYDAKDIIMQLDDGAMLTPTFLQQNGFNTPILILEKAKLGLRVPPHNFTIYDVEMKVGSMYDLHVIDVSRQEDLRMKMREFTEYYNSPVRGKVLNVISLEFSHTSLSELVEAPDIARNISWVENCWPKKAPDDSPHTKPVVSKYCLMSVKDCYTDFHVDFGGTSVWYHIVRGEKIFYFIEPTEENLRSFSQWVSSSDQGQVFFGEKVPKCYKLHVQQGNTLLIPTGWIHAVLTPRDSLVFGGNFLHSYNIPLQQKIYKLEKNLKTPLKFLFPNYETTNWYAARSILKKMKEIHAVGVRIPSFLQKGVQDLILALKQWTGKKDDYVKFHKLQIPIEINPLKLIKNLERELKLDLKISADRQFPCERLPCPGAYTLKSNTTVLKLKLLKRSDSESSTSFTPDTKKRKVHIFDDSEDECNNSDNETKSIDVLKINDETNLTMIKDLKDKRSTKIKLKFSVQAAQVTNDIDGPSINSAIVIQNNSRPHPVASPYEKPVNMKAEIEAIKKDLFEEKPNHDKKSGLYFEPIETENDCTVKPVTFNPLKNFPTKSKSEKLEDDLDDVNDGYVIHSLPKPKTKAKKKQSDDDSDYDPSDDVYYQDAEFVYPRIDVTSELASDDFSWKPGQRQKPKGICGHKRKGHSTVLPDKSSKDGTLDPFFAPDSDEEVKTAKPVNSSIHNGNGTSKSSAISKLLKEKPKKGKATVKQRLGKLLKLDKTGSRYVR